MDSALTSVRLKGHGAPSWAMDLATCWTNNIRDMINIQNMVYWRRLDWNNQKVPLSHWEAEPGSLRQFWGWNEVPIDRTAIHDIKNWDTIMIKLPAAICGGTGVSDTVHC